MGDPNVRRLDDPEARRSYYDHLLRDVRALRRMLRDGSVESGVRRIGAEQELVLVDERGQPARYNDELLDRVSDSRLTVELGRFNLEMNLDPLHFSGSCLSEMETQIAELLDLVRTEAARENVRPVLVGILPTLGLTDLTIEDMTPRDRYYALNDRLTRLHGGRYQIHVRGPDELVIEHDSMMMEACTTSFQVHVQVDAESFPRLYNIAQAVTAPVLAAATNSPLAFGKELWRETRIAVFQQAVNTRQGNEFQRQASPRVTFGADWVRESVLEIFEEDIARFRPLIGSNREEDPFECFRQGRWPDLPALQIFNSTVYRWNRPCYGVTDGQAHLRIENRVLPSGPTPADEMANAAFWLGLLGGLDQRVGDVTDRMSFENARTNFVRAATLGLDAQFRWLDGRAVAAEELILSDLLPLARRGLERRNVAEDDIGRYLGIIRKRVETRRTGSQWLVGSRRGLQSAGDRPRRLNALVRVLEARQREGEPVHTWSLAEPDDIPDHWLPTMRVEEWMSTDLFTVTEDESIEFALSVMNWRNVGHLPVEREERELVGILSFQDLARAVAERGSGETGLTAPVSTVMTEDPVTVRPDTPIREAAHVMDERGIGALLVAREGRLVGILTEHDFVGVARELMDRS